MSNGQELLTEDLGVVIAAVVDAALAESRSLEPDWRPLQASLPAAECAGFMWMDRVDLPDDRVEVYRHGITRHWLHIGHSGHFYRYTRGVYSVVDQRGTVESVFEGLSTYGGGRTTKFDLAYLALRIAELRTNGIRAVV